MVDLKALILCGGRSERMGSDKAFLNYRGKSQVDHLNKLFIQKDIETFISCKKEKANHFKSKNIVTDDFSIRSPLNGIASALQTDAKSAWLVVAVDMPMIGSKEIDLLLQSRNPAKHATYFLDSEGKRPHPLFTIYESKCFAEILSFIEQGKKSPRSLLEQLDCRIIQTDSAEFLLNINTPEEFERFNQG